MSTPAFRLRLPCIPFVPAISGSLISSCSVKPLPEPCFVPPIPPPPPPSFGCYEMGVTTSTSAQGSQFAISASITYPNREETGFCQPVINIALRTPQRGGGGGGSAGSSGGSSGSGGGGGGVPGRSTFSVLVDVVCSDYDCTIDKYYLTLAVDDATGVIYWVD